MKVVDVKALLVGVNGGLDVDEMIRIAANLSETFSSNDVYYNLLHVCIVKLTRRFRARII